MTAPLLDPLEAPPRARAPRIRWWLVVAFGGWSAVVWGVRTVNIWRDLLLSTDEKVVLTVMAAIFVVLGSATFFIGVGLRKWPPTRVDVITVGVLGGWTCGVWLLRILDIVAGGDHSVAFVIVHAVLAVVSVALAGLSWREVGGARPLLTEPPADRGAHADGPLGYEAEVGAGSVAADPRQ